MTYYIFSPKPTIFFQILTIDTPQLAHIISYSKLQFNNTICTLFFSSVERVVHVEVPSSYDNLSNYVQKFAFSNLTQWGRVTHTCVGNLIIIGSDNGLSAPSHYLNQHWNIVNWTLRNKLQWNFNRNSNIFIQENAFESVCEMAAILSRPQCVR